MSHRVDPPHDRVTLSSRELTSLRQLERAFAEADATRVQADAVELGPAVSARSWVLAHLLWVARVGPGLVVLGLVLMFAALPSSVPLSALGAVLVLLGVASTVRTPLRRLRFRARGRRDR